MTSTTGVKRRERFRSRRAGRASKYQNYKPSLLRRFYTLFLRVAFKVTMRLEIEGLEHFPASGASIAMYNHIAFVDPVIVSGRFPRSVIALVKIEAYQHWLTGPLLRTFDAIPVSRGDVDRKALQAAFDVLDQDLPLLIAPEGTRSKTATLLEAQPGVAYIASQAGVPIVPVAFSGSDRWSRNIKRLRRTTIWVRVGRPFVLAADDERLSGETLKQMTDEAMVQLASLLPAEQRGVYSNLDAATARYVRFVQAAPD